MSASELCRRSAPLAEGVAMNRIRVADGQIFAFTPNLQPVAAAERGEVFEVECQDSCGGRLRTESDLLSKIDLDHVNGATGPIEIVGARPGDMLRIRILDLRVGQDVDPNRTCKMVIPKRYLARLPGMTGPTKRGRARKRKGTR
ncbi:MAG TPA: hypothetical protein HA326_08575 [Thermoplasmata archaeon]|nr:hypothetical protein [Thermoplasmata archaeon]